MDVAPSPSLRNGSDGPDSKMPTQPSRSVVITHGIDSKGRDLDRLHARLKDGGFEVYRFVYAPSDGTVCLEDSASQLKAFVDTTLPVGTRFSMVAFSMGGLISRWYLDKLDGAARVDRFITLATPHRGTILGYLRHNLAGRQLRPRSRFLRDLENSNGPVQRGELESHSFWTSFDLMIVPAHSSNVSWASVRHFWVPAHPFMLSDHCVLEAVAETLARPLSRTVLH